jgi:hypothetical protein
MDLYRRMAAIRSDEDRRRAGRTHRPVRRTAQKRAGAAGRGHAPGLGGRSAGVTDITQKGDALVLTLASESFQPAALAEICTSAKYKRFLSLNAGAVPRLTLKLRPKADVLDTALELVEALRLAAEESPEAPEAEK